MSSTISRRALFAGTSLLTGCAGDVMPKFRGLYAASDALTYAAHKVLLRNQPLAREFGPERITKRFPVLGTANPKDANYQKLLAGNFADWRLPIRGMVSQPGELPLTFLKNLPSRTQITQQSCEEGWSAIAEWTGAPLGRVLQEVGILPEARYIVFYAVDGWWDSLDLQDALHPQTMLAYGMNGGALPVAHGAPIRLRVERQLGYKSLKFVNRIDVTDRIDNIRDGTGSRSHAAGFAWYAGI